MHLTKQKTATSKGLNRGVNRSLNKGLKSLIFDLHITRDQYLQYYRGQVKAVVTRARSGELMQFPASALRTFVSREGIQGTFCIQYSADGKLAGITREG